VVHPTCYGEGKATATRAFAAAHGVDLARSYFYTDSDEDLPLLEIVGHPRPTNPNVLLAEIAAKRGWPVRRFRSRGTPGVLDLLRTALAAGSVLPAFALGIPARRQLAARRQRRHRHLGRARDRARRHRPPGDR
jgi:putative phosphoserine phosphatase/1-acylglycerol-3-phosphate O-acyltransferase